MAELPEKDELLKLKSEFKTEPKSEKKVDAPIVDTKKDTKKEVVVEKKDATATKEEGKVEVVATAEVKPTIDSLSDDELIAALEKRGKKIATETLTDEQKKKQADLEDAEKRQYAIANLNVTAEQYDELKSIINSDGTELTKREFEKAYKSENKGASKEEIESAYKDYYNLPQNIKVKEKQKKEVDGIEEEVEVEVEKPKFDEKLSKWGESRIKTKAERIKEGAKQNQKWIDDSFANHKALVAKAQEYSKVAEKALSEIDFNALPVEYKFGAEGKEKTIKAIVKLDDKAKEQVVNYINNELAQIILPTDKYKDADEISKQIKKFVKDRYDNQVGESLYNLGRTEGTNTAKSGTNVPFESTSGTTEENLMSALEKSANEKLPKNPLI